MSRPYNVTGRSVHPHVLGDAACPMAHAILSHQATASDSPSNTGGSKSEEYLPWNVLHCHALVRPRLEHLVRHPLVHVTQNFRQRSGDERIRRFQRDCVACIRDRLYAIHGRGHRDQPPLLRRPHSHGRPPLPQPWPEEWRRHSHGHACSRLPGAARSRWHRHQTPVHRCQIPCCRHHFHHIQIESDRIESNQITASTSVPPCNHANATYFVSTKWP